MADFTAFERKGKENPYTSHNGNMFTLLHKKEVLAIRLPENERAAFIMKYKTQLMEAYGVVMKEYVVVPDSLIKKTQELTPYIEMSFTYVKTLKAKPGSKTKAK
jgi:hypothetical protein